MKIQRRVCADGFLAYVRACVDYHYTSRQDVRAKYLRALFNPSIWAAAALKLASSDRFYRVPARWTCLTIFSCDVGKGATIRGPINLPHPFGIVIGSGSRIGNHVTIYHGVTVGRSSKGQYPTILQNVTLYEGAIIIGDVILAEGTTVAPATIVRRSTSVGEVVKQ